MNSKQLLFSAFAILGIASFTIAQPCASTTGIGSSSNAFTNVRNATNAIAIDKDLNTAIFIHRNNAGSFGGHSGQLRYDISTNGGTTWSTDQGVLNPLAINGSNGGRYPQVAIYNPAGNTIPANAYLSYLAPTVGATFNGVVSGVRQLNGTGNTETYNQPAATQTLIPNSMCKGAPGVFWAVDAVFNGSATTGFRIYKGVWNGSSDVVWSTNSTITPSFNLAFDGAAKIGDFHIAFDPTGQIGWVSVLTHLTGGPSSYAFYPVFYKTTDGGNTWSAPIQVDLGQFNCITGNIDVGNVASTAFESDLTVDVNGEPHLLTTIVNGNNAYAAFFSSWHHMYDITFHFGLWNAIDIANVNAGRGTFGVAPNQATLDFQPMISRSVDGTKIFFAWSDNTTYTLGAANLTPNFISRAYNVTTATWTPIHDFTACNVGINGQILFPKLAAEVLEPAAGQYKMAAIYTLITSGDPILTANFTFLNNLIWSNTDFTISQPFATVNINEGSSWLLCPSTSLNLTVTGAYQQVLWSDNTVFLSTTINTPGVYTVAARAGCTVGMDTITVTGLVATVTPTSSAICVGDTTLISVSGNALSYSWNPGGSTNDSIQVLPIANTTYTLTAYGDGACTYNLNSTVVVNALPTVIANATSTAVCAGNADTLTGSGTATSYTWSGGINDGISFIPTSTNTYTVTGTDANGCISSDLISVIVNPLPIVIANATAVVLCAGTADTLTGSGTAVTYTWTGGVVDGISFIPSGTNTYTVSGVDANGCIAIDSIAVLVNALPTVIANATSTSLCIGNADTLTGNGSATSYSWSGGIVDGISFSPTATVTYTVTGTDANGCVSIDSITVIVNSLPIVVANATATTLCAGDLTTLAGTGSSTSYSWSGGIFDGIAFAPTSSASYIVIGTDANTCVNSDTIQITVNQLPLLSLTASTLSYCLSDASGTLNATPVGGTWSGPGITGNTFNPSVAGIGVQAVVYNYTDANSCSNSGTLNLTVSACVGINETVAENSFIVYPNPTNNDMTILVDANLIGTTYLLMDQLGKIVLTGIVGAESSQLEMGSLAGGIYFLTIGNNQKQTIKVIKY